jgi:MFS family permease
MSGIFRNWWPVFAALLLIQLGNGLTGSLVSVAGEARGYPPLLQGMILSAFFAGSMAGAALTPMLIRRTTHARAAGTFTLALAVTTLGFAMSSEPWVWVIIRMLAGTAITGMFVTVESWLNLSIADGVRARVFSAYIFIQLTGLVSGQLLLAGRSAGETTLFLVSAGAIAIAALCFRSGRTAHPPPGEARHIAFLALAGRAPLGMTCIALAGFSWAGLMASGPATLQMLGLSDIDKSLFMALAVAGGMAAQLPVGWMADHMDRSRVLLLLTATAALAAAIPLVGEGRVALFSAAIGYGAATLPLYAIGVARVSEVLGQDERTAAAAWMIILFNIGAVASPLAVANAAAAWGPLAFFVLMAIPQALFALAVIGQVLSRRRTQA